MGFRKDGGDLKYLDERNIQGYFMKDFLSLAFFFLLLCILPVHYEEDKFPQACLSSRMILLCYKSHEMEPALHIKSLETFI